MFLVPLSHTIGPEIINLFIVSEAGYTYQMLLQLRDIPSEQILIRNPDVKFSGLRLMRRGMRKLRHY